MPQEGTKRPSVRPATRTGLILHPCHSCSGPDSTLLIPPSSLPLSPAKMWTKTDCHTQDLLPEVPTHHTPGYISLLPAQELLELVPSCLPYWVARAISDPAALSAPFLGSTLSQARVEEDTALGWGFRDFSPILVHRVLADTTANPLPYPPHTVYDWPHSCPRPPPRCL